ncbi:MAG TPA: TRAP transporter substrate-binding protein [Vicinamibacteria bacterium]|nr:TRAP transporter substrate-binding protein [Vicinamibacteria bacterium]
MRLISLRRGGKRWAAGACLASLLSVLAACGGGPGDGKLVIRLGHIGFPQSPFDQGARKFKELLEARFPDRVEVRIFGSAQLGEDKEMLEGLRFGTLEMHVPSSVLHSVEPMFGVFDLPFLIEDRAQMEAIAEGPIGAKLRESLLAHDLVLLGFWENGFRMITNNVRPIVRPEDLRGIKIRTPKDPERVKLFRAFGANPTSMSYGEVFSALKQGVIDGQENPFSQIVPARFHEVQRYLSLSKHVYSPAYPLMSRQYVESLDEDIRRGIEEVAREVGRYHRELGEKEDARYRVLLEKDLEITEIDREAFARVAEPLFEEFNEKFGPELVEAIRGHRAAE